MPGTGTQPTRRDARVPAAAAGEAAAVPRILTVPGHPGQVREARVFIANKLADHGLCDDVARLLGSELITNSLQHSNSRLPGGTITVAVTVARGMILVEVTDDGGPAEPVLREPENTCAEGGRGLQLIARMSASWGYRRHGGRLATWFEIPAEPLRVP
jgi:serine/threonine-protein kinase RsbW